jgi:hypothetical protein
MSDEFVCDICNKSMDWKDCVAEEVLSRMGIEEPSCYDCVADSICWDANWRVPFTITKEEYNSRKAEVINGLRNERDEDFSSQAEDPYDDRDFEYDWEGRRDSFQSEF